MQVAARFPGVITTAGMLLGAQVLLQMGLGGNCLITAGVHNVMHCSAEVQPEAPSSGASRRCRAQRCPCSATARVHASHQPLFAL